MGVQLHRDLAWHGDSNSACITESTLLMFRLTVFVLQYTWKLLLLSCLGKLLWLPIPEVCHTSMHMWSFTLSCAVAGP